MKNQKKIVDLNCICRTKNTYYWFEFAPIFEHFNLWSGHTMLISLSEHLRTLSNATSKKINSPSHAAQTQSFGKNSEHLSIYLLNLSKTWSSDSLLDDQTSLQSIRLEPSNALPTDPPHYNAYHYGKILVEIPAAKQKDFSIEIESDLKSMQQVAKLIRDRTREFIAGKIQSKIQFFLFG